MDEIGGSKPPPAPPKRLCAGRVVCLDDFCHRNSSCLARAPPHCHSKASTREIGGTTKEPWGMFREIRGGWVCVVAYGYKP